MNSVYVSTAKLHFCASFFAKSSQGSGEVLSVELARHGLSTFILTFINVNANHSHDSDYK